MFGPEKIRTIQIFVLETSSIGFHLEMGFFILNIILVLFLKCCLFV